MRKLIRVCSVVVGVIAAAWIAVADEHKDGSDEKDKKDEKVAIADLPAAVHATLDKELPGAKVEMIEKEEESGRVVYDIEAELKDEDVEMDIAADGKVLSREDSVDFKSLPATVRDAAEKYFGNSKDLEAHKEVDFEKHETFYEVEGKKDGHHVTIKLSDAGKIVEEE